jgi:hypothetical protein
MFDGDIWKIKAYKVTKIKILSFFNAMIEALKPPFNDLVPLIFRLVVRTIKLINLV